MGHQSEQSLKPDDRLILGDKAWPIYSVAFLGGLVLLVLALVIAAVTGEMRRFAYAYLTAYCFVLCITLGCLALVIFTHLFRAGWVAPVRRVPEVVGANMPTIAALTVPVLVFVALGNGMLYPWAAPAAWFQESEHAEHTQHAQPATPPGDGSARGAEPGAGAAVSDAQGAGGVKLVLAADHRAKASSEEGGDAAGAGGAAGGGKSSAGAEGEGAKSPRESAEQTPVPLAYATSASQMAASPQHEAYTEMLKELVPRKGGYLNRPFFIIRMVVYLGVWTWMGLWFWKKSVDQDDSGDPKLSRIREFVSAPCTLIIAVTFSLVAFDLLMSLDPVFSSTVFGVYYFAGMMLGGLSVTILVYRGLQSRGHMPSVNVEHYHDLGKLLFTFVFFWGYIAFAQYMLLWYGNIPHQIYWWEFRGGTTVASSPQYGGAWAWVTLILLFGKLLVPFAALLSRHVKRHPMALPVIAAWLLVMQYVDIYWMVMPVYDSPLLHVPWMSILVLLGVGGIAIGGAVRVAAGHPLMSVRDPRMPEALAHENL